MKECVKVCPYCNYLMFCDDKNLPYGSKSKRQLEEIAIDNLKTIKKFFDFDIVVLACNTLSCTALSRCREEFKNTIFVGTVPAVKPALEKFDAKDVLVLATPTTMKHNVLINKNPELLKKSMPSLAREIDKNLDNLNAVKKMIKSRLKGLNPKAIVLGCTHYFACKDIFSQIFPDAEIFDSANGVARRLLYFVGESEEKNCQVQLMVSADCNLLGKFWWHYING